VQEICKGETPYKQAAFVLEQLNLLQEKIEKAKEQIAEMY
jgi:hypothetical protein